MGVAIAFWVLAAVSVASALAVVITRDIFRAALFLVLCFLTIAGIYITLGADFLAAVQVLIYIGAISVLIIFAIMLTREAQRGSPSNRLRLPALAIGVLLLATLVFAVLVTPWNVVVPLPEAEPTTAGIAARLFDLEGGFVLPFEIVSVLLLAAAIGAIVLARDR